MKKVNYHTHTYRCNHAWGTDEEFVQAAIRGGIRVLGFSDHGCWKYDSKFRSHIRMELSEFDEYYESLSNLREKYKDQIRILIGMECEYFPKYMEWLKHFIKEKKLDYVIFGNHYDTTDETGVYYGRTCNEDAVLKKYVDDCIAGMSTGVYAYLAHPDLFMRGREKFDTLAESESRRLCKWCKEHGAVLEYNLEGARFCKERGVSWYPHPEFWEIAAETGNDVIIGYDAHLTHSLETEGYYEEAVRKLKDLGMNVLTDIPLQK